jgi:hypothetical protein
MNYFKNANNLLQNQTMTEMNQRRAQINETMKQCSMGLQHEKNLNNLKKMKLKIKYNNNFKMIWDQPEIKFNNNLINR